MKKPTKEQLLADIQSDMTWAEIAAKYGYKDDRFLRKLRVRYGLPRRRIYLKPSKEQLWDMIVNQRLSPYEVAEKLGYSEGGWSNIYAYCRQWNIPVDFKPHYEARHTPITDRQKSIVLGSLLGDGYVNPQGFFIISHGRKQLDYLEWKKEQLMPFMIDRRRYDPPRSPDNTPFSKLGCYSYSSIAHPWFKSLRDFCYVNGRKTLSKEWLDQIDDVALAVWYMDDGSLNKRYGTIVFCTMGFSYEEHCLMQRWFSERWGIETKIEPRLKPGRETTFALRINASQSKKLLAIISRHVPPCMQYKVGFNNQP